MYLLNTIKLNINVGKSFGIMSETSSEFRHMWCSVKGQIFRSGNYEIANLHAWLRCNIKEKNVTGITVIFCYMGMLSTLKRLPNTMEVQLH